jgi:hypothetical protein
MNSQPESVGISFDVVQYQDARIWEKGLRMACGRCHRSPRLKHFIYNTFYAECIKIAEDLQIRVSNSGVVKVLISTGWRPEARSITRGK